MQNLSVGPPPTFSFFGLGFFELLIVGVLVMGVILAVTIVVVVSMAGKDRRDQ
jgi:hypothetical protein